MRGKSDFIVKQIQDFYNQAGAHFSRTRQKKYGGASSNWRVTDKYLTKLKPGQRVLDLGCGNGKLVTGLTEGVEYLGTDFSETLLAEARKLHPERQFMYSDVLDPEDWEKLGKYEAIFCVAVLHHIPSKEQQLFVLKQAKNHLKTDGFLYLTVWNLWQEQLLQHHLDGYALIPYNKEWQRYCVIFDLKILESLFADSGWNIEEIFYADREGNRAKIQESQNIVVIAK